jgi:hypothetical protein
MSKIPTGMPFIPHRHFLLHAITQYPGAYFQSNSYVKRQKIYHMLDLGIIRPSSSSWSSPVHLVPKKTPGDLVVIIVPSIMILYQTDTLSRHHSFSPWITYFSRIDLICTHHHILVEPADVPKNGTRLGLLTATSSSVLLHERKAVR